jgi:hypothetical protein
MYSRRRRGAGPARLAGRCLSLVSLGGQDPDYDNCGAEGEERGHILKPLWQAGCGVRHPCLTVRAVSGRPLEFGRFPRSSLAETNPQGWQRVAGGRSGQGGSDHRKAASERGAPRRGARAARSSARSGSEAGLAPQPGCRASSCAVARRSPPPKTLGDLRLPSANPSDWPNQNVQTPAGEAGVGSYGAEKPPAGICEGRRATGDPTSTMQKFGSKPTPRPPSGHPQAIW